MHSFARLHTHTHSGKPDKAETTQTRIQCHQPSCRCVLGSKVQHREAGKAHRRMRFPQTHTHTHSIDIYRLPHTSALVVIGSCGRVDLTRQNTISRRRQEVCPGGQDASEIHFLTLPQHQHSLLPEPLLSSRKAAGWGSEGEGSEGKCNRGGQVTSCCGQKSVQSPVMLERIGWEHSIATSSSFLPRILFPPLSSPHRSEPLHLKNLHFLHKSPALLMSPHTSPMPFFLSLAAAHCNRTPRRRKPQEPTQTRSHPTHPDKQGERLLTE